MRARVVVLLVVLGAFLGAGAYAMARPGGLALTTATGRTALIAPRPDPIPPKLLGAVIQRGTGVAVLPAVPVPEAATTAAPTVTTPPAVVDASPPAVVDATTTLPARLGALVAESGAPADAAVAVVDATGRELFSYGADRPVVPASTQKLFTAAAALASLGPEWTFSTTVTATAAPDATGTVTGDLVLVGDGDPTLASPVFATVVEPERPSTPLVALADQVVAAGVTHVTGAVLGDPTALADQPTAVGWLPRYFDELDATYVSGLTVDAGRQLYDDAGTLRARVAPDPAAEAAAALTTLLVERGVAVDHPPGSTRTPPDAPVVLGEVSSPPLAVLLTFMVQESDNHMADAVFRTLGRLGGSDGSWEAAAGGVVETLRPLQLNLDATGLRDGSGLSRDDRTTARLLALLDAQMSRSNLAQSWVPLQAVTGLSGTLSRRLTGTIAEGVVRGKTGSLADVSAIAGAAIGPDGTTLHFAVVGDGLVDLEIPAVRRLQDLVMLELTAELHGCLRVAPAAPPDPAVPPWEQPLPAFTCG